MINLKNVIDLSVPLMAGIESDPEPQRPQIYYSDHKSGLRQMMEIFPGTKEKDFPDKLGWAVEDMKVTTHAGTHIDAPYHYHETDEQGQPMATIDDIPLDWFYGPGVKLDFSNFEDGHIVTAQEVETELERIHHRLHSGDIVLVQTSAGKKYGKKGYVESGCGMGEESTLYLTSRGVRLVGTDAWSWDIPLSYLRRNYQKDGDASKIWEAHFAGRKYPYCQMEKLGNLDKLPSIGFYVLALPVNIYRASAGWCRPIAILNHEGGE